MSGGISTPGQMSLQDFMRLYAPTVLPQASPVQPSGLAALAQPAQAAQQPTQRSMGFTPNQGQGQGSALSSLGQSGQAGQQGAGGVQGGGQMQPGHGGLQQLFMNALTNNGPNGNSNAFANAVGYVPFGTGSFG